MPIALSSRGSARSLEKNPDQKIQNRTQPQGIALLRAPMLTIAIGVAIVLLYYGAPVFLPLLLAIFLFLLLDPVVNALESKKIPRVVGATLSVLISVCVISGSGFAFYSALKEIAHKLPAYSEKISTVTRSLRGTAERLARTTEGFLDGKVTPPSPPPEREEAGAPQGATGKARQEVKPPESPVRSMAPYLLRGFTSVLSLVGWVFFIPLISLFLLLEKKTLASRLRPLVGDAKQFENICRQMQEMSRGFFLGNFVVWVSMTIAFTFAFFGMKLDGAFQLALFAGFLNLVPVFGSLLGAVLPAAQAFLQFDGLSGVFFVLLSSLVIHFVGNNIIMPKFLGNRVNVNASAAMIGFLFWGALWGAPGLFLAVPLMAALRIFLDASPRWEIVGNLLSNTPTSAMAHFRLVDLFRRNRPRHP